VNDWYPLHRERYALHLPVVYGLRVALHRNYTMRDHSAQPREDVSIAGVVACGKRSTRGPSRSCVFCVDTWQSVVPVPGVLWMGCMGMGGVGPHRVCGRPGILHHQLQRNTTASSPRLGALAEYVLTHSGSITPRDIRQLQLPHPCRGTLWRPRLGRVGHVSGWRCGPEVTGFAASPLFAAPRGRAGAGAGGLARGRDRGPPRCLPRTSDQGTLETVWTQRMRGGR